MPASVSTSLHSEYIKNHNKHARRPPKFTRRNIKKYFTTRFTELVASKEERAQYSWNEILNPFAELKYMTWRNWNYFFMGFAAWTWDAVDFFAVSLNTSSIATAFDKQVADVTWGITLALMVRPCGAIIFGYWADRYGRKWPYIINLALLSVLQVATGFVHSFQQFLAVRSLFGLAMGGVYGFSLATALDDSPVAARGILSGIYQQGYAFGYLLAVVFNRAITYNSPHGWRALFWFASGPPVLFIVWRFWLPETEIYRQQREEALARRKAQSDLEWYKISPDTRSVLKTYWLTMVYCVLLMAGLNFLSHGSQDLYPTLLTTQLEYGADRSTVTNSVANLGAIFGGIVCGHASQFIGRRFTMLLANVLAMALIYPWAYLRTSAINAAVFFMQAGVQGIFGVIPIFLSELAPPAYRSLVVGLCNQMGTMVASACTTIESTLGERFPIVTKSGVAAYDYSKVMSIFVACVLVYVFTVTLLGPENRNTDFGPDRDTIYEEDMEEEVNDEDSVKELKDPKPSSIHVESV